MNLGQLGTPRARPPAVENIAITASQVWTASAADMEVATAPTPAYATFKALKAKRKAEKSNAAPPLASEVERARAAQRSRQTRLTMSQRVDGEQLDASQAAAAPAPTQAAAVTGEEVELKSMTLEERWAAEDAAAKQAQTAAAAAQPGGLAAAQPLMAKASALLAEGKVEEARGQWDSARKMLAAAEVVPPPLGSSGPEGSGTTINTFIEIPSADEMMRQMQVTAVRMMCIEGLMKCDLRLGRWKDAAEGATSMLAVAPRDVDALLVRGRARASMSPPQTDDARKDFERVVRIGEPEQKTQAEQALRQLQRASVVRGRWRPSPELQAQLAAQNGSADTPVAPAANTPKFVLPLTVEAVSASGRRFRLFVIANSSGESPGDVWGGLEKPDGTVVKYEGGFDIESGALALKHQDTLIEGGATHAIQGKIVPPRAGGAAPSESFELKYSQWWADITQIEGGEGGREEYTWTCTLAPAGGAAARTEYSTEFGGSKASKAAKKYLEKLDDEPAPAAAAAAAPAAEPEPEPAATAATVDSEPRPANLEEVFDMAIRLELVTEQGVAMMRRNIARGRRSEAHFLKQWSDRIDKELAERRAAQGLPEVGRADAAAAVGARKAQEAAAKKPVRVKVAAPGESVGVLFDEIFGGGGGSGGTDQLEADMGKLLGGLRAESGVFGASVPGKHINDPLSE